MRMWEETSYHLDLLQADADCIRQEFRDIAIRSGPDYLVTFDPDIPVLSISNTCNNHYSLINCTTRPMIYHTNCLLSNNIIYIQF